MEANTLQAKDLRIGNIIEYDNKIFEIDTIANEFPTLNTDEFGIGVVDWHNIKPIPLSEDILLKLGFRKSNSQNIMFLPIPKFGMEIHYEMHGYGNVVVIKSTTGSIIPNDIEYLHQIQNLFHSLTNEELTIKE